MNRHRHQALSVILALLNLGMNLYVGVAHRATPTYKFIPKISLSVILGIVSGLWVMGWMVPCIAAPMSDTSISATALPDIVLPDIAMANLAENEIPVVLAAAEETPINDDATGSTVKGTSGAEIFEIHCAGCHMNGGNIIRRGKNLKMRALRRNHMDTVEAIAHIVTVGKRPMSAYADTLSPEEIEAVSAYVLDQAQHDWK